MQKLLHYPGALWRLRSVLSFFLIVFSVPPWGTVILILVALGGGRLLQTKLVRMWLKFVCRAAAVKFNVEGIENHNPNSPSLVVSNHQSLLDIPAAFTSLGGNLRMVAKKELFKIPFFGWCLAKTEFIPVDRGNRASGQIASEKIKERILSGLHIWVAPEGTRSVGSALGPFKKGSFAVAIQAGIGEQPILVMNSCDAVPKGSLLIRPGSIINVKVLPRISTLGYKLEDRGKLAEEVRQNLVNNFS